jgi:phosphatidylethanolamine-binding protein (PEBP) family uncharacterized protein
MPTSPERHWESLYRTKSPTQVSWYQPEARLSLDLICRVAADPDAPVIDVGGGASTLVDGLLGAGYRHISVLDLAPAALTRAQERLDQRAAQVNGSLQTSSTRRSHPHSMTSGTTEQYFTSSRTREIVPGMWRK